LNHRRRASPSGLPARLGAWEAAGALGRGGIRAGAELRAREERWPLGPSARRQSV
jgi:hypothetical protein